jgi:hypothetical protein
MYGVLPFPVHEMEQTDCFDNPREDKHHASVRVVQSQGQ